MESPTGSALIHAALLYSTPSDAAARVAPLVAESLDLGHAVLVCLEPAKTSALVDLLGAGSSQVTFLPHYTRSARPAKVINTIASFIASNSASGTGAVHAIGEIAPSTTELDVQWIRYEAAVNDIFASAPLRATCLYSRDMSAPSLRAIERTHPHLGAEQGLARSTAFQGAAAACAHMAIPRLAPARHPDLVMRALADPREARASVNAMVPADGHADANDNLAVVVSELVTNAILHGDGAADLSMWLEPRSVFLNVRDSGPGIDDPFAGLRPPDFPERGAGLWVTHHLCDHVTIERSAGGGTSVTVQLDLAPH